MLSTKIIFRVMMACVLLYSCQPTYVPVAYRTPVSEVETNPFGSWIRVEFKQPSDATVKNIVMGELISIQYDSVLVLVDDHQLNVLPVNNISSIQLFTHNNQSGTYMAITTAFILPNIIGAIVTGYPQFLLLGIPVVVTGIVLASVEGSKSDNLLIYPAKNDLQELRKFARFPVGMLNAVERDSLLLKNKKDYDYLD